MSSVFFYLTHDSAYKTVSVKAIIYSETCTDSCGHHGCLAMLFMLLSGVCSEDVFHFIAIAYQTNWLPHKANAYTLWWRNVRHAEYTFFHFNSVLMESSEKLNCSGICLGDTTTNGNVPLVKTDTHGSLKNRDFSLQSARMNWSQFFKYWVINFKYVG